MEGWCKERNLSKGGMISINTGWRLARAWYGDRLAPSWQRKTGAEIRALFADLGMTSPFWDLGA